MVGQTQTQGTWSRRRSGEGHARGFTLIELLVVIAIIALLVGILLPSLGAARKEAQTLKCSVHTRNVVQGVAVYQATYGVYPLSYAYAIDETAPVWDKNEQGEQSNGKPYIHWSHSLMADGDKIPGEAFKCPSGGKGGTPRTNPGTKPEDKEDWQGSTTTLFEDWQAPRMAYFGNAAIFPRNKLNLVAGNARKNVFVNDAAVTLPSKTILVTEYLKDNDWSVIADSNNESKGHRGVSPFVGGSSGAAVYKEPDIGGAPRFFYPAESDILKVSQLPPRLFSSNQDISELNAVGRSHPGGDRQYGGLANFAFVDGHVERMTVLKSIKDRLWGDKFYSLSGRNNKVADAGY